MELDYVEQSRDDVTIYIEEKLQEILPVVPECSIYRVPKRLLNMNPIAYVPQVISIGPFHHNEKIFKATEELKLNFFNSYRCRLDMRVQDIVELARSWERRARQYYSEPIYMNSDEFVKMMILDGCFVVEFIYMRYFPENENRVHSSLFEAIGLNIHLDLIMLENQLPFFVLQGLFDLVSPTANESIKHFELLVHSFLKLNVLPTQLVLPTQRVVFPYNLFDQRPRHLVDFLSFYFVPLARKNDVHQKRYLPPSATQLREAGVVFKKVEREGEINIMDISFKDGILKIPPLQIDDTFETCVRNLMAYEQFFAVRPEKKNEENIKKYAIHYYEFLDELITTEKDVSLLAKEGIIINCIGGSDGEISQLFNDLCKNITVRGINCFSNISKELKDHCERRRNRWMAALKHNYFNTPWAFISFLAATFLILLTLLQTIFSAISIFK